MPKTSDFHSYSDRQAFDRLMLLIATFIHHPGIGSPDRIGNNSQSAHESLEAVQAKVYEIAQQYNIQLTKYSIPTLRKDLVTLRKYGILEQRIYRWGYFLGTGVMSFKDLQVALNALNSMAKYQRSPQAIRIYQELERKLRGKQELESTDYLYPVRSQINHLIVTTDLEDRVKKKQAQNRYTLFDSLTTVEQAILDGQAIEIYRHSNPYAKDIGEVRVYPLQILYHDIAWYLLYENCDNSHFVVARIDRLSDHCILIPSQSRSIQSQKQSLDIAHQLLMKGWGLFLGDVDEQEQERQGLLEFEIVRVRFFAPVIPFIEEGTYRHPTQQITRSRKPDSIDLQLCLPPRSLNEFSRWVNRFMDNAIVLAPEHLVFKHAQAAQRLADLYKREIVK